MNKPEPAIRITVDPTNPGQFFACCGLLELADRLWPGAEGWFDDGEFCVATQGTLREALTALTRFEAVEVLHVNEVPVKALFAPLDLTLSKDGSLKMRLDPWMKLVRQKQEVVADGNRPWNFWSGQQTSLRIWTPLRKALIDQITRMPSHRGEDIFSILTPLPGRFGFDPGAAWNALDTGFSPNEQNMDVASSPAVELLAAVGLQRFRPPLGDSRTQFTYCTWGKPLAVSVAAAAMCGTIDIPRSVSFQGRVVSRGSYAALGFSNPLQRSNA